MVCNYNKEQKGLLYKFEYEILKRVTVSETLDTVNISKVMEVKAALAIFSLFFAKHVSLRACKEKIVLF